MWHKNININIYTCNYEHTTICIQCLFNSVEGNYRDGPASYTKYFRFYNNRLQSVINKTGDDVTIKYTCIHVQVKTKIRKWEMRC